MGYEVKTVSNYFKNKRPPASAGAARVPPVPWAMGSTGLLGRESAVSKVPRAQDALSTERAPAPGPGPPAGRWDRAAERSGVARARRARGAGRAGSSPLKSWTWRAASRPARKRGLGQKGGVGAHNVFLVRDSLARASSFAFGAALYY